MIDDPDHPAPEELDAAVVGVAVGLLIAILVLSTWIVVLVLLK